MKPPCPLSPTSPHSFPSMPQEPRSQEASALMMMMRAIKATLVTAKTFCGKRLAKAALPLRYRLICQGFQPLSMFSDPLLSTNGRGKGGIVEYYCQDRQET